MLTLQNISLINGVMENFLCMNTVRRHLFTKATMTISCFKWLMYEHITMHVRDCSLEGRMLQRRSGVMEHTKGINGKYTFRRS
jgi:hypothetical protein